MRVLQLFYLGLDNHLLKSLAVRGLDCLVNWGLALALENQQGASNAFVAEQIVAVGADGKKTNEMAISNSCS